MYALLFTTGFLLIMALFSSSEMADYKVSNLQHLLYKNALATISTVQGEVSSSRYEGQSNIEQSEKERGDPPPQIHTKKGEPIARSLDFNLARPPNNGKLNLAHLFSSSSSHCPQGFSYYEAFARLLRELYGKEEFFKDRVRVEYRILDALQLLQKECMACTDPDDLAALVLEDEELQSIYQKIFQGGTLLHSYPSLLDYITFDKEGTREDRKINFLFASPSVLRAVITEEKVVASLLEERGLLWKEIEDQELRRHEILQKDAMGRLEVQQKVRLLIKNCYEKNGVDPKRYKSLFDPTLGKKGTIFYAKNPLTHTLIRQKLPH